MATKDDDTSVQAKFYLPKHVHARLKAYAHREKTPMSVVLKEILLEALPE